MKNQFCTTTKELCEKYFGDFAPVYERSGKEFCVVSLLSDVQSFMEHLSGDSVMKEHYRVLLNDVKCVLMDELIKKQEQQDKEKKPEVAPVVKDKSFDEIYAEADEAGRIASNTCIPGYDGPTNIFSVEGACGFAWVNVECNTAFGRWLKKSGKVKHRAYGGGYDIWCHYGNQSMTRKEAWASEFARVLENYGIEGRIGSRMD